MYVAWVLATKGSFKQIFGVCVSIGATVQLKGGESRNAFVVDHLRGFTWLRLMAKGVHMVMWFRSVLEKLQTALSTKEISWF